MINNTKIEALKMSLPSYLLKITKEEARGGRNMYKCPLCGSGNHNTRNSDGALSVTKDGKNWKCFSCDQGGDIFKLIELYEGITDFKEQVRRAEEVTGTGGALVYMPADKKERAKGSIMIENGKYRDYIEKCKSDINETDYFKIRGFSQDGIERFNFGYDKEKKCIVIPYDRQGNYYTTRSIEGKTFRKPKREEAGEEPIYNRSALDDDKPCFICEGPLDASSIMEASKGTCNAISLGGVGVVKLREQIKKQLPKCSFIISLDNDDTGRKATGAIAEALKEYGLTFIIACYSLNVYPEDCRKDPNDYLKSNSWQLEEDIKSNIEELEKIINVEKVAALEAYNVRSAKTRLKSFINGIQDNVNTSYIPTGFNELDKALDGGLYPGLYILGAISSLGKTTLLLQIADQIAAAGHDILYFSLEMAASELISKSISRLTFLNCDKITAYAKTSRGITTASRYEKYSNKEKDIINLAYEQYAAFKGDIIFYEGIGDIGIDNITEAIQEHNYITGRTPLIFIDYLQILAPNDVRASDKTNTDKAVLELKRLSRDYNTPVVAISSFNRDNYTSEVNMTAFKESGAIEYGSDVLMALQPQGMKPGYTKSEQKDNSNIVKACKKSDVRDIELLILKNRNGASERRLGFIYHSLFNNFEQDNNYKPIKNNDNYIEDELVPFGLDFD